VGTLALTVLGRGVRVRCADDTAEALLSAGYGALRGEAGSTDLDYSVGRPDPTRNGFRIERHGQAPLDAADDGTLLAVFDADIAVAIQHLRPDLYVVHAGVLVRGNVALMLVARSGVGKSTLTWALLHHGFSYLSDELAPVDLATLSVLPFPRALMVKRAPPAPYPLPATAVRTSRGFHVPSEALPSQVGTTPAPLAAIFFLERAGAAGEPSVRALTAAEGAARLYANTLNSLAHGGDGLDGAIRVASARPCFRLVSAELPPTCALVTRALDALR
jgi:hypothetical protein